MPNAIPGLNATGQLSPGLSAATVRSTLGVLSSSEIAAAFAPINHAHAWGSITGTLSSQTDLQNALNAKLALAGGTMTGDLNLGSNSINNVDILNAVAIFQDGLQCVTTGDLANYQPLDADLSAIGALIGTSGLLRKTAANTWTLDTATYLTGNQEITISGDATGSGTTAITLALANSGVSSGTYKSVTVDTKGRVTGGTNPTTLSGFGILDGITAAAVAAGYQPLDGDLTSLAGASSTNAIYYRSAANTWSPVTIGANLTFSGGTLAATGGGGGGDALTTNPLSQFAATTSAQLAGVISDETGSGSLVFATSPTLVTPNIGAATGTSIVVSGDIQAGSSNYLCIGSDAKVSRIGANSVAVYNGTAYGTLSSSIARLNSFNLYTSNTLSTQCGQIVGDSSNNVLIKQDSTTGNFYAGCNSTSNTNGYVYLQQAGANKFLIGPSGRIKHGNGNQSITDFASVHLVGCATNYVGLIIDGLASHTADYINCRTSGGTVEFSVSTGGSLACANVTASGLVCAGIYTVATLPTASTNAYKEANVSDSSVTTWGATVSGGGSNKVLVRSNGTNWTVVGI